MSEFCCVPHGQRQRARVVHQGTTGRFLLASTLPTFGHRIHQLRCRSKRPSSPVRRYPSPAKTAWCHTQAVTTSLQNVLRVPRCHFGMGAWDLMRRRARCPTCPLDVFSQRMTTQRRLGNIRCTYSNDLTYVHRLLSCAPSSTKECNYSICVGHLA
jgi:hypothetical protein